MERRWTQRTEAEFNVELHFSGCEIADCRMRDISLGGLYLKRGALTPAQNDLLELVFTLDDAGKTKKYRMPARVARVDDGGMGISFKGTNISAFRALREIFRHKSPAAGCAGTA